MTYAALAGALIILAAFAMMRIREGGWFFDRLVGRGVLVAVALWLITMLLAFWATPYPSIALDGAPSRSFGFLFILLPAGGIAAVAFPELLQRAHADAETLRWAEGAGWVLVVGPFLVALYRRMWLVA